MDIKSLEFFVTACEKGSLSKAADCLYTSQPNVSKIIRTLELEIGKPLLERSGKGVKPTVYGEQVLEHAKMILKTVSAINSLTVTSAKNSLKLSSYPSNMISMLLVDFYKEMDGFPIEHREGTVEEIVEQVSTGISEIGIVYVAEKQIPIFRHILSHKELEFIPLGTPKKICLYVGPKHPLYKADSIDFSELPTLKYICGVRDFFSMEHHLKYVSMGAIDVKTLNYVVHTDSDHSNINMLLNTDITNLGLDFIHEPYRKYNIRSLPVKDCEAFLQIGCVQKPEAVLSKYARWFIERFCAML